VGYAYLDAGADVIEIGVPFSDPLADGPTIQDTTTRALANGADLDYCLGLASGFADRAPVVFLLYYNVILARGAEGFLREAAETGVSGLVIPDLPVDEIEAFAELAAGAGVALCPLVAPTSTDERVARVGELATGFVYCVSVAGVTGVRDALPPGRRRLRRWRSVSASGRRGRPSRPPLRPMGLSLGASSCGWSERAGPRGPASGCAGCARPSPKPRG
jgi:tryptophan synthase alpha chain